VSRPGWSKLIVSEDIAAVVAEIRAGRAQHHRALSPDVAAILLDRARTVQPVVDATAIYKGLVERSATVGINLYDDFPSVVSPWDEVMIAYVNRHGNVMVMQAHSEPWRAELRWDTPNDVDWDRVRWIVEASVWVGGHDGTGRLLKPRGPVRLMQHAVYDDGAPADMHWVAMIPGDGENPDVWEMPTAVFNAAFNFLSCSNVEIAEPIRPFPVRKRLRQTGVTVQTIVIRPPGRRTAAAGSRDARRVDELDAPLTHVRGGFKHYGARYDRGKLFGKLEGKFWVAAHARGKTGEGVVRDYVLHPDPAG
jgi:hypothetical protein